MAEDDEDYELDVFHGLDDAFPADPGGFMRCGLGL
jgi:hypothetical protein